MIPIPDNRTQEQIDLDIMKIKIRESKIQCFDGMTSLTRTPEDQLKHTGHKTIPDGLFYYMDSYNKQIKKLIDAHLKKYPD